MEKKTKVDQLKEMMKAKEKAETRNKKSETAGQMLENGEQKPEEQISSENITAQIKAAEDEAKAHYDKLLRVMAEFENFKKRIERERIEHLRYSNQSLITELLPVLDDFDRVLNHIPQEATQDIAALADGVKLIQNHFMNTLSKYGLMPLESSVGKPFDPSQHEAVAHIESAEHPEGAVAMEHRRGWKLHDRIIRAATVSVSKGNK